MIRRHGLCLSLIWIGLGPAGSSAFQPATQPATSGPIVKVDRSIVDVGICWCGSATKADFLIQNLGRLPLEIVDLRGDARCELAPKAPRRIEPNHRAEIPISAIVPSKPGVFEMSTMMVTNDSRTPGVIVKIRGEARLPIEVNPPMAGFGKIREARPAEMIITLTNHFEEPVKINYEKIEDAGFTFDLTEKDPGAVYLLKVALKPPLDPGMRQATINLTTDLALQPNIPIRAVAYLSPRVELVPNMIMLGPPDPRNEVTKVVTFMNNGETPIRLIEATCEDPAVVLSISEISPGKGYKVVVTLPKNYDPGTTIKAITLHTDDARKPDYEVGLVGPSVPTAPSESRGLTIPIGDLVGKPAPKFDLATIDGLVVNNATAAERVLALNFFTSNNFDNTMSVQNVETLRKSYEPRGVRFINVAEQAPAPSPVIVPGDMHYALKKAGVNAELAVDVGNIAADAFHLAFYPTLVVLDKTGRIEFAVEGNPNDFMARSKAHFEALLGPAPSIKRPTTSAPTPEEIQRRPALGMMGLSIPQFTILTIDKKPVSDEEIQNVPATVLNFVAADCGFCKRQMPQVESIREEYEKKGVRFINVCETLKKRYPADEIPRMMLANGSRSELSHDPDNKIGKLFKVTSFPTMFVVRRDGRIENVNVGVRTASRLRGQLDEILKNDASLKGGQ